MAATSMTATLQHQEQQRIFMSDAPSVAVRLAATYLVRTPQVTGESLTAWQSKINVLNPALAVAFAEKVRDYRAMRRTSLS